LKSEKPKKEEAGPLVAAAIEASASGTGAIGTGAIETSTIETGAIERKLQQLLASLPAYTPLSPEALISIKEIKTNDKDNFLQDIDSLIENLEKHLQEWKAVKELSLR
jgi:ParB family transcriptional regulator, chromosome partitioning protein